MSFCAEDSMPEAIWGCMVQSNEKTNTSSWVKGMHIKASGREPPGAVGPGSRGRASRGAAALPSLEDPCCSAEEGVPSPEQQFAPNE